MKALSVIFIFLGMVVNFFYLDWVYGLIGCGIGIWMLATLGTDKKSVAAGVLGLLFTGMLGGIFYLCWNPEKENN